MGKYRDQIKVICAYPWGLRLAEIADEIDARVDGVSKGLADLTARTETLEARVTACCASPLKDDVAKLRADLSELKTQIDTLAPKP